MSDIATSTVKIKKSRKYGDTSFSVMKFNSMQTSSSKKASAHLPQPNKVTKPFYTRPIQAQSNGSGMFACSKLPDIPEPPAFLRVVIDELKSELGSGSIVPKKKRLPKKVNKKSLKQDGPKKAKTKLNAFMAYRAFYSRDIFSTQSQRKLSSSLSKAWAEEESQLIWKRYATEYNAQTSQFPNVPFVEWLMKTTGSETDEQKENREWMQNVKSGLRIQDIFFNDQGELMKPDEVPTTFDNLKSYDNFISDLDFDTAITNGKAGFPIDPIIENLQNNNSNFFDQNRTYDLQMHNHSNRL